jgi:hypothetical protein
MALDLSRWKMKDSHSHRPNVLAKPLRQDVLRTLLVQRKSVDAHNQPTSKT